MTEPPDLDALEQAYRALVQVRSLGKQISQVQAEVARLTEQRDASRRASFEAGYAAGHAAGVWNDQRGSVHEAYAEYAAALARTDAKKE